MQCCSVAAILKKFDAFFKLYLLPFTIYYTQLYKKIRGHICSTEAGVIKTQWPHCTRSAKPTPHYAQCSVCAVDETTSHFFFNVANMLSSEKSLKMDLKELTS